MKWDGTANKFFRTVGKPPFIYGTAWKKESTKALVGQALAAGFTAFDTAAQPKHYREDLVGEALREAYKAGTVKREDLFIQTKFTPPGGQDESNAPYSFSDPLETQISKSVASSLRNFRTSDDDESPYIDCLLLHSPLRTLADTLAAWKIIEGYVPHKIRSLGISNADIRVILALRQEDDIKVKPSVVQNRFYPATRFDSDIRRLCLARGVVYESFWTLTGNPALLRSAPVQNLAKDAGVSQQVALYSLVMETGVAVLNGTTNQERMLEDLRDVDRVKNWSFVYGDKWRELFAQFQELIEDQI